MTENGFEINRKKVRLQKSSARQQVTGLTTNHFPNVRRTYVRQIRAMLHAWRKFGVKAAEAEFRSKYDTQHRAPTGRPVSFVEVVAGKIGFLQMIRGQDCSMVQHFRNQLAALDERFERDTLVREIPPAFAKQFDSLWVLEGQVTHKGGELLMRQGTAFHLEGYGLVTCAHAVIEGTVAFQAKGPSKRYPVRVTGSSADLDLAVAEIDAPATSFLRPELAGRARIGDKVILLGFPNYALSDTGRVAEGRIVGIRTAHGTQRIIVDTDIGAGNSGGPVLNSSGRVIGVAVTGSESPDDTDLNAAISIDALRYLRAAPPAAAESASGHG